MEAFVLPLGLITIGLVAARLGLHALSTFQQLVHQREHDQLSLELLKAQIAQVTKHRERSSLAWNGYRKFEIQRRDDEASGVCSFYLVPHDAKPLPTFLPGQYLTFRLAVPGREKPVIRCYSLSDCHCDQHYRITVKRVSSPGDKPAVPPGLVSNYFHEQLAEGDIVDVQAPRGNFFLDPDKQRPMVMIAGGVGITPLLSMMRSIVATRTGREVLCFYGVRNGSEHAFKDELQRIAEEHSNVRLVVAYSQPAKEDEVHEGRDYHHTGRVSLELLKSYLPSTNFEFYICGPPAMMETLTRDLAKWGVAKKDILTEAFGPATVTKALAKPKPKTAGKAAAAATAQVKFSKSGKSIGWTAESTNLLDLALDNGVQVDSGCRAGNCGTCVLAIKSGKVAYLTEHGAELEAGTCLACIAAPDGDLELDA